MSDTMDAMKKARMTDLDRARFYKLALTLIDGAAYSSMKDVGKAMGTTRAMAQIIVARAKKAGALESRPFRLETMKVTRAGAMWFEQSKPLPAPKGRKVVFKVAEEKRKTLTEEIAAEVAAVAAVKRKSRAQKARRERLEEPVPSSQSLEEAARAVTASAKEATPAVAKEVAIGSLSGGVSVSWAATVDVPSSTDMLALLHAPELVSLVLRVQRTGWGPGFLEAMVAKPIRRGSFVAGKPRESEPPCTCPSPSVGEEDRIVDAAEEETSDPDLEDEPADVGEPAKEPKVVDGVYTVIDSAGATLRRFRSPGLAFNYFRKEGADRVLDPSGVVIKRASDL